MDPIERLSTLFRRFPGIGPRQAERFVQFLLRSSPAIRRELMQSVQDLGQSVHQCSSCCRFSTSSRGQCPICSNAERDKSLLMVVASDSDLLAMERSSTYRGHYFVLGGTISLASEKTNGLRIKELCELVSKKTSALKEVILAFPINPEGDATMSLVREELTALAKESGFKVTSLGRGLSTGSELEYADSSTLQNAIDNRG